MASEGAGGRAGAQGSGSRCRRVGASGRGSGCFVHLGVEGSQEGRGGTDRRAFRCQVGGQVRAACVDPGAGPMRGAFGSDCGQSHAWGCGGCGGSGHRAGGTGRGMERLQPVPATSRVSGNVPRPGLVSARKPCQAVPAGSAARLSWRLGRTWRCGRAVSPRPGPGRSAEPRWAWVPGGRVTSGAQDAGRRGGRGTGEVLGGVAFGQ